MHRPPSDSLSKPAVLRAPPFPAPSPVWLIAALAVPATWLLTCCGTGADLVSTVALPTQQAVGQTPGFSGGVDGVDGAAPADIASRSAPLQLTPAQREYLEALGVAGVHPANELRALSIGSYVCQARAAGQSPQAVRDSVAPMVRSDVADAQVSSKSVPPLQADAAITTYISIATQRLCK